MEKCDDNINFGGWEFDENLERFDFSATVKEIILRAADTVRNQFVDDLLNPTNPQFSISDETGAPVLALVIAEGDLIIRLDLGEIADADIDEDDDAEFKARLAASFRRLAERIESA